MQNFLVTCLKASVRAKVEHPLHVIKNLFRHRKTRCRGLANRKAQLCTLFGFANLVLDGQAIQGHRKTQLRIPLSAFAPDLARLHPPVPSSGHFPSSAQDGVLSRPRRLARDSSGSMRHGRHDAAQASRTAGCCARAGGCTTAQMTAPTSRFVDTAKWLARVIRPALAGREQRL